jgi:hypothetical protein
LCGDAGRGEITYCLSDSRSNFWLELDVVTNHKAKDMVAAQRKWSSDYVKWCHSGRSKWFWRQLELHDCVTGLRCSVVLA